MKQALQALEGWAGHGKWIYPESALEQAKKNTSEAIPVLRAAIEQAEIQEPVAYVLRTLSSKSISDEIAPTGWSTFESKIEKLRADPWVQNGIAEIVPLYTSPQPNANGKD
jgi:hypothetical protein